MPNINFELLLKNPPEMSKFLWIHPCLSWWPVLLILTSGQTQGVDSSYHVPTNMSVRRVLFEALVYKVKLVYGWGHNTKVYTLVLSWACPLSFIRKDWDTSVIFGIMGDMNSWNGGFAELNFPLLRFTMTFGLSCWTITYHMTFCDRMLCLQSAQLTSQEWIGLYRNIVDTLPKWVISAGYLKEFNSSLVHFSAEFMNTSRKSTVGLQYLILIEVKPNTKNVTPPTALLGWMLRVRVDWHAKTARSNSTCSLGNLINSSLTLLVGDGQRLLPSLLTLPRWGENRLLRKRFLWSQFHTIGEMNFSPIHFS